MSKKLVVLTHPLIDHKMAKIRDKTQTLKNLEKVFQKLEPC